MALIDKASLLMVPSTYEDGTLYNVLPSGNKAPDETGNHNGYDQTRADFSFSRGSNLSATRIGPNGLIEKGRENLLLQSNQFDTTWTNTNSTETTGFEGYDGTNNAWKIDITATYGQIIQSVSVSGVNCASVYVKAGTLGFVRLRFDASPNAIVDFDLSDGSTAYTSGIIDASSELIGNGWYRINMVSNVISSTFRIYPLIAANDLTGSSGSIYIQNAQLEYGLTASSYLDSGATTATAGVLENTPRIDYSSGAGALLLEPQRTNSVPSSEYIASWAGANTTIVTNAGISPEGVNNATSITFASGGYWYKSIAGSYTAGSTHIWSIYANTSTRVVQWGGFTPAGTSVYDIEDVGNGWYRQTLTRTTTGSGSGTFQPLMDWVYVGVGTEFKVYGAQLEYNASYPSSYVPTYGSAATRGADVCIDAGNSDVFNDSEGVLFIESSALSQDSTNKVITISDGTTANRVQVYYNSSNEIVGSVAGQAAIAYSIDITQDAKIAFKYKANDFALWVNGTEVGTDTLGSAPSGLQEIDFHNGASGSNFYGNMKQLVYFNEALSDSELATLTTL